MSRHIPLGLTAGALGVLLLACGPKPEQGARAIEEHARREGKVTVGGCLREQEVAGRFRLADATLALEPAGALLDGSAPLVTGKGPITGTLPVLTAAPDYIVEPPDGIDLQAHLGHQLQVTGVLDSNEADTGAEGIEGVIRAEEVRLIANRCLGG